MTKEEMLEEIKLLKEKMELLKQDLLKLEEEKR